MTRRLQVEVVRADELVKGDEAIIVEFRGVVESTREGPSTSGHPHKTTTWIALEGAEGAELAPDSQVLRVVPAEWKETQRGAAFPQDVSPFLLRCADTLAGYCWSAIEDKRLDARSPIGDAVLSYRDIREDPNYEAERVPVSAEPTDAQVEAAAKAMWGGDEWEAFGRCYPWDSAMPDCVEAMAQVRRGLAAAQLL